MSRNAIQKVVIQRNSGLRRIRRSLIIAIVMFSIIIIEFVVMVIKVLKNYNGGEARSVAGRVEGFFAEEEDDAEEENAEMVLREEDGVYEVERVVEVKRKRVS